MSESKQKLLAEIERQQSVIRAAALILHVAPDYYEGVTSEELERLLAPLREAMYGLTNQKGVV